MATMSPSQYGDDMVAAGNEMAAIYSDIGREREAAAAAVAGGTDSRGNTALGVKTELLGKLEAQARTQKFAATIDFDHMAQILAQDITQTTMAKRDVAARIAEKSSVSLFSDPLQALVNEFTLPWDKQEFAGLDQQLVTSYDALNKINASVQQTAVTSREISTKITQAAVDDVATATQQDINAKAAVARASALEANAHGLQAVMNASKAQLDAYTAERQERHQQFQENISSKQLEMAEKEFGLRWEKEKNKDSVAKEQLSFINAALVADGKTPLNMDSFSRNYAVGGLVKDRLDRLMNAGMQLGTEGRMSHGNTVQSRYEYRNSIGFSPTSKEQQDVIEMQQSAHIAASKEVSDKKMQWELANTKFRAEFDDKQSNIKNGDNSNFLRAATFSTLSNQVAIASQPAWQKVIAPTITESNASQTADPQVMLDKLVVAIADKKISQNEAVSLYTSIYKASAAINNENLQLYKLAGIEQTKFGTKVSVGADSRVKTAASAVAAAGLAGMATGVGTIPSAAVVGMAGAVSYMEDRRVAPINAMDPVQVNNVFSRAVANKLGFNVEGSALFGVGADTLRPAVGYGQLDGAR